MIHKLGARPVVLTHRMMAKARIVSRAMAYLGTPPAMSFKWGELTEAAVGNTDWLGMLGNGPDPANPPGWENGAGDCVIAQQLRAILTWTSLGAGPIVTGTTQDAFMYYGDEAAWKQNDPNSDQGTDPNAADTFFQSTGLLGVQLDASAAVSASDIMHLQWACHIFGGMEFCIDVPDYFEDSFNSGVWDYTGQSYQIEGGHSIRAVQYSSRPSGAVDWAVVSWGKRITLTAAAAERFLTLGRVQCAPAFVKANGTAPNGLALPAMLNDLNAVTAS